MCKYCTDKIKENKMDFTFTIIDIGIGGGDFGISLFTLNFHRSLLGFYYSDHYFQIDFLFIKIVYEPIIEKWKII